MSSCGYTDPDNSLKHELKISLHNLAQEAKELYLDREVPRLDSPPSPLSFYRDYVAPNKPVIIHKAFDQWPALEKWNSNYFRETIGDLTVSVAVTPNGYADAITNGKFVMPLERQMKMSEFLDIMDSPEKYNGVFYIQKQNSNLTEEFSVIISDVEKDISLGTEAFGKTPDAVNFWMGDSRAVTSMHRDHYENLYCVVSGWKKFTLIPPTDLPFVPYETYHAANYHQTEEGEYVIKDDPETGKVPWVAVDAINPDLKTYPEFGKTTPIQVTVNKGEMLYLPSLWFHHVQQSHACIAVNYWYDMEFDIKYNYYKFMENIVEIAK